MCICAHLHFFKLQKNQINMKNTFLLLIISMLLLSSCVNQKSIKKWMDKHEDIKIKGDTTYIDVPFEKVVTIELPGRLIVQEINCDDFKKPLIISDDSTGLELEIIPIANTDSTTQLRVITRQKPITLYRTIRDTIEAPVNIEYRADILAYEAQADSFRIAIEQKERRMTKLEKKRKRFSIFGNLGMIAGISLLILCLLLSLKRR